MKMNNVKELVEKLEGFLEMSCEDVACTSCPMSQNGNCTLQEAKNLIERQLGVWTWTMNNKLQKTLGTISWLSGLVTCGYTIAKPNIFSFFIGLILFIFGLATSSDRRKKWN